MKKIILFFCAIFGVAINTSAAATIVYKGDGESFEGHYFAGKSKAPGIVLIPNYMGVSAESDKQAQRFQKLGYNVFVADVYGKGVRPKDRNEAGALAGKYKNDRKLLRKRVSFAIDELKKQKNIDTNKIAVVGYCFGGTAALEAARNGESIAAVITFHGGLDSPTPEDGAKIKAKVLALHGAIDPFVKEPDVQAFEKEMQINKVNYELDKYSGAVHSFTDVGAGDDISKGTAYNATADRRSFERAKNFLEEVFQ
ncbi:MAG: dienelactone hydrolase family protein [Bdellovibrio sp.]